MKSKASERRLHFIRCAEWEGWLCDRCGWHQIVLAVHKDGEVTVDRCQAFDSHDCEDLCEKVLNYN